MLEYITIFFSFCCVILANYLSSEPQSMSILSRGKKHKLFLMVIVRIKEFHALEALSAAAYI